jgi:non-ribosomal peptide synthetase component E (peptide arylation enzyme)
MTAGRFDLAAHARAMRAGGFWLDKSFDEFIVEAAARTPDKPALVGYRADREGCPAASGWRQLADLVARCAAGLRRPGRRRRRHRRRAAAQLVGVRRSSRWRPTASARWSTR